MFSAMIVSMPSLVNIGLLLFVVFLIFAVVGLNLFGQIARNEAVGFTSDYNFEDINHSLLSVMRYCSCA